MIRSSITHSPVFNGLPINASPNRVCYTRLLDKLHQMMTNYCQKHSKSLFIRFDLTFPKDRMFLDDNSNFIHFLENYKKQLSRGRGCDPVIYWVREHKTHEYAINHHYHLILMVNGSVIQSYMPLLFMADHYWTEVLGLQHMIDHDQEEEFPKSGLVNFCTEDEFGRPQENGILLERNPNDPLIVPRFGFCFNWGSYLCKTFTKGNVPFGVNEYDSSPVNRRR